jgi:hypothetical protein
MNKLDRIFFKYFIFAIPLVATLLIWGSVDSPDELSRLTAGFKHYLWDGLGWIFMLWILVGLYLLLKLVTSLKFREAFFQRFKTMNAQDEREEQITGHAAKFSMLSSLALLFFFLFLSIFTINIGKHPDAENLPEGKRGFITIGMNFYPFSANTTAKEINTDGIEIFKYSGFPLSASSTILILIFWQIGFYQLTRNRINQ